MRIENDRIPRRLLLLRSLEHFGTNLCGGGILGKAAAWMMASLSLCFSYLALRFLWPGRAARLDEWIPLGKVDELPSGEVDTTWVGQQGIYLIRQATSDGEVIVALRAACTHLGCMTHWDTALRQFVCPCHGSAFDIEGRRLRGPARRPLERSAIRIRDGVLEVNLHRSIRQGIDSRPDPQSFVKISGEPI